MVRNDRQGTRKTRPEKHYVTTPQMDLNGSGAYWYVADGRYHFFMYSDDGITRAAVYDSYARLCEMEPLVADADNTWQAPPDGITCADMIRPDYVPGQSLTMHAELTDWSKGESE